MGKIIGPFTQILTLEGLQNKGALQDSAAKIIKQGAIIIENGKILECCDFENAKLKFSNFEIELITRDSVAIPGFVDCHTHIAFAGTRMMDYAMRSSGKTYLEIAQNGGGIWSTVLQTRNSLPEKLLELTLQRIRHHLLSGVTTIEIKSGYGLNVEEELKILRVINQAKKHTVADLVPTCLAAHIKPKDFNGSEEEYLREISSKLLPLLKSENLANRIDIFIEKTAFTAENTKNYIQNAKNLGFDITIHADQFSSAGAKLAAESGALSADHLEVISNEDIQLIANSKTVAVALPGASFGLGMLNLTPARKLLDAGASVAIASDWNPGSAPMGDLLTQAAIFGAAEKLSMLEVFSALTFRAASALNLFDRGKLEKNMLADFQVFETADCREILYNQGSLKPYAVYKNGNLIVP
jgi:imidazolonepropionase